LWMRWSHNTQAQSTASHCWLTSSTSDCSRMHSKASSYRLRTYIKVTRPVFEILKMTGHSPDRPLIFISIFFRVKIVNAFVDPRVEITSERGQHNSWQICNSSIGRHAFYIQYKWRLWVVRFLSQIPAEKNNYSILRHAETGPWAKLNSCLTGTVDLCPWDKLTLISI
jgi:hypothetical protein